MTRHTHTTARTASSADEIVARSGIVAPAILALMLGAFLVLGAGFAHSGIIHNAAHDARHSFAFPCH